MKKIIILIILGGAGYFGYQYFIDSSQQNPAPAQPTAREYMIFLPEKCQKSGELLKTAFQRHKMGEIKKVQVNGYAQPFRRCLRQAGFTDSEISEAYDGLKDSR